MRDKQNKSLTVQIPVEIWNKIEELADKNYTNNSSIVRKILADYFKEEGDDKQRL